jgi:hypothetical protein
MHVIFMHADFRELSTMRARKSYSTRNIIVSVAAAMFAVIGTAFAKDVPLNQDNVGRFLASFAEMKIIALTEGMKAGTDSEAAKNPVAAVVKAIKSSKLQSETKNIAARHGFATIKEWTDTGRAIAQAYVYITVGPSQGVAKATLDKHKDTAMKELGKLGLLSDKQKQKLQDGIDDLGDQLSKEPPRENVAIVKQMKAEIDAVVKIAPN